MNRFPHFNQSINCEICGKNDDKEAVLIPIYGSEEGGNMGGIQVHLDCIELFAVKRVSDGHFLSGEGDKHTLIGVTH